MTTRKRNAPCPCGSGSKYKNCCWVTDRQQSLETFNQVFLGKGQEPLTDELIVELVAMGWEEKYLLEARAEGAKYSRARNSIMYPLAAKGDVPAPWRDLVE